MHINITGRHFDVSSALEDYVGTKFAKLDRHFDQINDVNVVLGIEKLEQIAEATLNLPGEQIFASTHAENMYKAIDLLLDKLDRQLIKFKEKNKEHRHHGRDLNDISDNNES